MHTPHSSQVLTVINNFKKVLPMAVRDAQLSMKCVTIRDVGHPCGTMHCVAGWYGIAVGIQNMFSEKERVSFRHGANELANHLGFSERVGLENWANYHPELWGNDYGDDMFASEKAYTSPYRRVGAKNLQHIIDHWTEVYERLLALENPKPLYQDLTKQLAVLPTEETVDVVRETSL